jgi:hypothetical protein
MKFTDLSQGLWALQLIVILLGFIPEAQDFSGALLIVPTILSFENASKRSLAQQLLQNISFMKRLFGFFLYSVLCISSMCMSALCISSMSKCVFTDLEIVTFDVRRGRATHTKRYATAGSDETD